jgi:hypothetical protein
MSWRGFLTENLERRPGQKLSFALAFTSIGLYVQLAYFTPRSEAVLLIASFSLLFAFYIILSKSVLSFKTLLIFGIIYRTIFVFSTPALSDDFYRFFWDGVLIVNRINPFHYLPSEIIENPAINIPEINAGLYGLLNSPEYYTVYPPICQFFFWISAWISGGNISHAVLTIKVIFLMTEMGSIYLIWNLLKIYKRKKELTLLYLLNPLVIIELVGNIHFEAIMIFAVLLAVYSIAKQNWIGGALAFALAIIAKLTPLLLLPFFIKKLKLKKSLLFYLITLSVAALAFLPFAGRELIHGLGSSIGLYFQKFEFNASVFYVIRAFGFWMKGYDVIQEAGIWMAIITFLSISFLAFFQNNKSQNIPGIFIWPFLIYFTLATIVHPWYIIPLIAFCLFTNYRFPIVWSYTIFLSYLGYSVDGFQEQTWVLWLEYVSVFGVLVYELLKYKDLMRFRNPWQEIIG